MIQARLFRSLVGQHDTKTAGHSTRQQADRPLGGSLFSANEQIKLCYSSQHKERQPKSVKAGAVRLGLNSDIFSDKSRRNIRNPVPNIGSPKKSKLPSFIDYRTALEEQVKL
jgi:hypothetical protein